jgi:hypothetical protein
MCMHYGGGRWGTLEKSTSLRIAVRSREKNTTLKNKDKWF